MSFYFHCVDCHNFIPPFSWGIDFQKVPALGGEGGEWGGGGMSNLPLPGGDDKNIGEIFALQHK